MVGLFCIAEGSCSPLTVRRVGGLLTNPFFTHLNLSVDFDENLRLTGTFLLQCG